MRKRRVYAISFCSFDLLWNQSQQQFGIPFSSIISMFCNLVPIDSLNFCSPDHDYYNLLLPSFAILIQHMERVKSQNTIIFSVCYQPALEKSQICPPVSNLRQACVQTGFQFPRSTKKIMISKIIENCIINNTTRISLHNNTNFTFYGITPHKFSEFRP